MQVGTLKMPGAFNCPINGTKRSCVIHPYSLFIPRTVTERKIYISYEK
jgi:hypothetical protein